MVLLCGASAVSAASDNAVDNLTSDMDDSFLVSNNLNAVGVDESASVAQENDDGLLGQSQNVDSGVLNVILPSDFNFQQGTNSQGSFFSKFSNVLSSDRSKYSSQAYKKSYNVNFEIIEALILEDKIKLTIAL